MHTDRNCPRCQEGTLQVWDELNDEEREVVKRLPASAEHNSAERRKLHQWCTRCWYEATMEGSSLT
ncbi:MAG TPA: hypothetical protein VGW76_09330 [Pyrinomonadaceae bacterium]|nr:hypothetical protein [Pyrinomonadaceae bacterium]